MATRKQPGQGCDRGRCCRMRLFPTAPLLHVAFGFVVEVFGWRGRRRSACKGERCYWKRRRAERKGSKNQSIGQGLCREYTGKRQGIRRRKENAKETQARRHPQRKGAHGRRRRP